MKRRRTVPLLLAFLLLTGCAGKTATPGKADAPTEVQRASAAPEEAEYRGEAVFTASQTEAQARPMTEEDVLAAYERAEMVYAWFTGDTLPTGEESITLDGKIYRRVEYPGIENMEDLRTYLRGSFSQELTDRLLENGGGQPPYRDVEGVLYAGPVGRDQSGDRGELRMQVEQTGDTAYVINVTADLVDSVGNVVGVECGTIPYERAEDRWVFTDFRIFGE